MPILSVNNLTKSYGESTPIRNVSFEVNKGDVISIIGPSGCGKSTLIRCLNMLEKPTAGSIILEGYGDVTKINFDLTKLRKKVGMVFQTFNLFEHRTVVENIMMAPMDLLHLSKKDAYDRAMNLLDRVGLTSQARKYPNQLSGGQKQRVAIARTLAMEPEVILFDEPTSALDPLMVREVLNVINDLAKSGTTMLIVTHEMNFAKKVSNRVFYLDEGGIYEQGSPIDVFENPKKEKTILFIKQTKQFKFNVNLDKLDYSSNIMAIEDFSIKNNIDFKKMLHLENIYEEVINKLQEINIKDSKIEIIITYHQVSEELSLKVYSSNKFELDINDDLSSKIIKGLTSKIDHDDDSYTFTL